MKKISAIILVFFLALFSFISCGKKTAAPSTGSANAEDLLNLVPVDSQGVIFIDAQRAMSTAIVDKAIKEDKNYAKYQEFTEKTKIDPQKDLFLVTIALAKTEDMDKEKAAGIINLKYNKDDLLALIKEKATEEEKEISEEDYNGIAVYSSADEEDMSFSFIDDSNIVVGNDAVVKSILDVFQKKKDNISKNQELSSLIAKSNKNAIFWGAILLPPESMDKLTEGNPMLGDFKGISAISLFFDYKNKNIIAEIKALGGDDAKNKQIAEALTGFKALGAMAATQKPAIGQLLDGIEITSAGDHVKINATIPEEVIEELKKEEEKEEGNEEN